MAVRPLESDGVRLQFLNKRQHISPTLFGSQDSAVEPDLEKLSVVAPQLGQLLCHHGVIFNLRDRPTFLGYPPVSVEIAVSIGVGVDSGLDSVFLA